MAVTDFSAGEIATELLKQLIAISRKSAACRSSAEQLIVYIQELLPIIQEIKLTGNELPQHRQRQLDHFSETLSGGRELANKVLNSPRWNVFRNIRLARKMEKLEKAVSRFMKGPVQEGTHNNNGNGAHQHDAVIRYAEVNSEYERFEFL
ncbi:hypothetical protein Pfo_022048 [Paulownia fortunei]|nr:hypothetical protein Pfo_022048 [Paulownia fortunei]